MATNRQTLGVIGSLAAAVGAAVLPWASVDTVFGSIEISGIDGDGKIALALAALALIAAVSDNRFGVVAFGVIGVVFMGYEWNNVESALSDEPNPLAVASVGSGIYVGLAGFALVLVSGLISEGEPQSAR